MGSLTLIVLTNPGLGWVIRSKDHVVSSVEDNEGIRFADKPSQRQKSVVQSVVVWRERVGDVQVNLDRFEMGSFTSMGTSPTPMTSD